LEAAVSEACCEKELSDRFLENDFLPPLEISAQQQNFEVPEVLPYLPNEPFACDLNLDERIPDALLELLIN
jgi:hypothetical protein